MQEALKCYWKAHCVGDIEGGALFHLARMYESTDEPDQVRNLLKVKLVKRDLLWLLATAS